MLSGSVQASESTLHLPKSTWASSSSCGKNWGKWSENIKGKPSESNMLHAGLRAFAILHKDVLAFKNNFIFIDRAYLLSLNPQILITSSSQVKLSDIPSNFITWAQHVSLKLFLWKNLRIQITKSLIFKWLPPHELLLFAPFSQINIKHY